MLKTFLGVLSIILALFLIIFGVYVYTYLHSRKTVKLEKNQCTSSCENNIGSCVIWNQADQKCYPGSCGFDKLCYETGNKNDFEQWQKNVLISSSIVFVLCFTAYIFN